MNKTTLVTVNWNNRKCTELLLKSYVKYHYTGVPLNLILVDNDSKDDSRSWYVENEIPVVFSPSNIGHENGINLIFNKIATPYALINDTDFEYTNSVSYWEDVFDKTNYSSIAEPVVNYFESTRLKDRLSPWVMYLNIEKIHNAGIKYFRDPSVTDWTYDVGSWITEQMINKGLKNLPIERLPGDQDRDLISMVYENIGVHFGKCSWNVYQDHLDRFDEVIMRLTEIEKRLDNYKNIELIGKFKSGLKS